ncbi:MAG: GspH/FimT family pseudopilin [Phycisphaerae bacterium]|jgi:prepilin-type N-terminal cleavage/methylation domain-containing protein|nr:GspH/FimT family pseudopilin [Phycisphaerae bacterium]
MTNANRNNTAMTAGGFTLTEVLMTVIVIVIAATVVVPLLGSSDYSVTVAGARRVASDLQYAQDMAIATQKDITVGFDVNRESYWLSNESGVLIHPITNNAYTTDFRVDKELSQLDIVTVSGGGLVTFDPIGVPNRQCNIVLRAGRNTFNVTVSSVTGTVSVTVDE